MTFIYNFVSSLLMPPGIFIAIVFSISIYSIRKPALRVLGIMLMIVSIAMYVTSIPIFAFTVNNIIEHIYKRQLPPRNVKVAVVVLSGGVSKDENRQPFQPSITTMERLFAAVKLSKENPSCEFLIMSGCDPFGESDISIAEVMKNAAETMDCHAKIIIEDKSRNTDENLEYSAEIIKRLGVKHVVIVTSNSHMERAMNFAHKYIPNNIKIYAYPSGGYKPEVALSYEMFLPDIRALFKSCKSIQELLGNILAKLSL